MDKVVATAQEAVADVPGSATLTAGGSGPGGVPVIVVSGVGNDSLAAARPAQLAAHSDHAEWPEFATAILDPQGGATLRIGVGQGLALVLVLER